MVMDCKAAWQLGTISLPDALARGLGGVRSRHPSSAASAPTVVYLTTQHGVHGQAFLINIEETLSSAALYSGNMSDADVALYSEYECSY